MTARSIAVMIPNRSAAPRNSPGRAIRPSGSRIRTSVSTATMRPVPTSATGWKYGTNRDSASAARMRFDCSRRRPVRSRSRSDGSCRRTRAPPRRLAWCIARSAARKRSAAPPAWSGNTATPALAVSESALPSQSGVSLLMTDDDRLGAHGRLRRARSGQEDRDLVASDAPAHLAGLERRAERVRHRAQVLVAREETVRVVQRLEVVEAEDDERERAGEQVGARDLALELEVELLAVREAREGVGGLGDGLGGLAPGARRRARDVPRGGDEAALAGLRGEARGDPVDALAGRRRRPGGAPRSSSRRPRRPASRKRVRPSGMRPERSGGVGRAGARCRGSARPRRAPRGSRAGPARRGRRGPSRRASR